MIHASRTAFVLSLSLLLAGCRAPQGRPDAPRPADETGTVDFRPLQRSDRRESSSVVARGLVPGLMDRVLLGPNLVLESSRSSAIEPPTHGPKGGHPSAPTLPDALGVGVDTTLSAKLMAYLVESGSDLFAPAVTRVWAAKDGEQQPSTWVERALLLHRFRAADDPEGPTCLLAVRSLGAGLAELDVVVTAVAPAKYEVQPRRGGTQASVVAELEKLVVPMLWMEAELVSVADGRILARIDEKWVPKLPELAVLREESPSVVTATWTPEYGSQVLQTRMLGPTLPSRYVQGWSREDVFAKNLRPVWDRFRAQLQEGELSEELVREFLDHCLSPLFARAKK